MEPGGVLDSRFELESLVGTGGMADVYRARDVTTGSAVAIKVLRVVKAGRVARFAREGAVLARMLHPHIVRYVAHGRSSDATWLAMEWLDGEVLESRLEKGALQVPESIALARGAAEALAFAHGRGILHRDVKPGNLFLPGGRCEDVKVLDFGVARVLDATLTRTGVVVGTPAYLSPEQARGAEVDARTDLFSLGCVLYECLTGRRAFSGASIAAVLTKVLFHQPTPVRALEPRVSASLSSLVERLMDKNPEARPTSASAVISELDRLGATEPAARRSRSRKLTDRELRLLTVVLVDGVGSPGDAPRRRLRAVAERYGAQAEWLADGSLVVVLSSQRSATDQATLAARCALEIRHELRPQGISVATGRGALAGALPTGEVIDRAASLVRTSPGAEEADGSILLDEVTFALLDTRFEVVRDARGARLTGERAHHEPSRLLLGRPAPYVGRERELAGLSGILAECVSEHAARAVLVSGPPGIGKSRLRQEFFGRLASSFAPATVYLARGDPMSAGSPFHMVSQLVLQAAVIGPEDGPAARRTKLQDMLARHLPPGGEGRVAQFLGELIGAAFPDEDSVPLRSARQDRMVMADQVRRAFEDWILCESAAGPLILVLEDLHWGDAPSIRLIDAALRAAAERPFLVLALARPEVRDLWPSLWSERGLQEIHLGKLPRRAGERLARGVLGEEFPAADVERIVAMADGNVFFLEELIRQVAAGRRAELPQSVLSMVTVRLEALEPFERRVLRCASVFGERFWRGGLVGMLGGQCSDEVGAALAVLVEREIVVERMEATLGSESPLGFRHALLRDAAYAMLTDGDRVLGHRLAAEWLERRADTEPLSVAEHFEKGGVPSRAVKCYQRAAVAALHGNDLAGAVERVRRAISCGATGEILVALQLIAAEANNWDGHFSDGRAAAFQAYQAAPSGSSARDDAVAQLAIAAVNLGDEELVARLGRELLESGPGHSLSSRARTYAWVTGSLLLVGDRRLANDLLPRLVECYEAAGVLGPPLEGLVERIRSLFAKFDGDLSTCRDRLDGAIAAFERAGDLRNALDCAAAVAMHLLSVGDYPAAELRAREVIAEAERLGIRHTAAGGRYVRGVALAIEGRLEEGEALEREALASFLASGSRMMCAQAHGSLATILSLRGALPEAEHEARAAVSDSTGNRQLEATNGGILAQILLAQGCTAEALSISAAAHALLEEQGTVDEGEILVRLVHAEALAANGREQAMRPILSGARQRLLGFASRIANPEMRERFLREVPENARTLRLAAQWLGDDGTAGAA